ncbi:RNA-binding protein 34-like [Penaeus indicus]|uniref:RNA-binding protein 34-like n=1 Tax=Penaeus indicus TaxID=29960 RepID=UPI00300DB51B
MMVVSSDSDKPQHDSMGNASKEEKKTSKKVPSSKKQQMNKGLYMKKLKKMLEADGATVNPEANSESKARNNKSPSFGKERNKKIQQTLEANKGIGNKNKREKPWGKDSTKAENRKRTNENQTVENENEGSKKFKPMVETVKRSSKSWKKRVVEGEETHVKPHKIQSEKEESQLKGDSVFVGNIDLKAKRKGIQKFFQTYGEVEGVRICSLDQAHPQDRKNIASFKKSLKFQQASQCAYVRFKSAESATAALEANNKIFRGYSIVVFSSCGNRSVSGRASVFVGNVPVDTNEDELGKIFQECGEIESVRIFRESNSDTERAIAYINFETPKAIPQAIKKNNTMLRGQGLRVQRYSLRVQMEKNRKKISANKQKREERASVTKPRTNRKNLAGREHRQREDWQPSNYGNRPFKGGKFRTMGGDRKNFEDDTQMLTDVKPRKHIRFDEENNTSRGNMRPQSVDFQPMSHVTNMEKPKLHLKFDD